MQNNAPEGTGERHVTTAHTAQMPTNLSPMKLNSQGHLQPHMVEEPRPKQADIDKRKKQADPVVEKRAGRPATRAAAAGTGTLTADEITALSDQDITDAASGKAYLKRTLLTPPGESWTAESLASTLLQVTQLKGVTRPVANALHSVAFVLNQLDVDAKGDNISQAVKSQFTAHAETLISRTNEATSLINKTAAEATKLISLRVNAAMLEVTKASTSIMASVTQLHETTTTCRGMLEKATDQMPARSCPASSPASTTLNA